MAQGAASGVNCRRGALRRGGGAAGAWMAGQRRRSSVLRRGASGRWRAITVALIQSGWPPGHGALRAGGQGVGVIRCHEHPTPLPPPTTLAFSPFVALPPAPSPACASPARLRPREAACPRTKWTSDNSAAEDNKRHNAVAIAPRARPRCGRWGGGRRLEKATGQLRLVVLPELSPMPMMRNNLSNVVSLVLVVPLPVVARVLPHATDIVITAVIVTSVIA